MSCYHPLKAFRLPDGGVSFDGGLDYVAELKLPCGWCVGCLERRARDWTLRAMHEAQMWPENCVVALTYARDCLPPDESLCHRDFELFMKRLRKRFRGRVVRYAMCGEYGTENGRPHYHAILFNVDFQDGKPTGKSKSGHVFSDSPLLEKLWGHGLVSVQPLTPETCGYVMRYVLKKQLQPGKVCMDVVDPESGEIRRKRVEYATRSLKPGIGAMWYEKFGATDVDRHDFVVREGQQVRTPAFYDKLYGRCASISDRAEREAIRFERASLSADDQTPDRLAVREQVHLARLRNFKRDDL